MNLTARRTPRFSGLQVITIMTGVMAALLGGIYIDPDRFVVRPTTPPFDPARQVNVVQYVEQIGPVWPAMFLGLGLLLLLAGVRGFHPVKTHILAMAVWTFYGAAVLAGSLLSEPPRSIVVGVIGCAVAGVHYGLVCAYKDVQER